eukprot:125006_1
MSPLKEQLFITEIVHILNVYIRHPKINTNNDNNKINNKMILAVLNKFIKCIESTHHQVAERSLMVWRDETIKIYVDLNKQTIWPIIIYTLQQNQKKYWLPAIRDINRQIIIDFKRRDTQLFQIIEKQLQSNNNNNITNNKREQSLKKHLRQQKWKKLKKLAQNNKNNNNNKSNNNDEISG